MHPCEEDLIDENRKGSGEAPGTKDLLHTLRPRVKDFCLVSHSRYVEVVLPGRLITQRLSSSYSSSEEELRVFEIKKE